MVKKCKICGVKFTTKTKTKLCCTDECTLERKRITSREYYRSDTTRGIKISMSWRDRNPEKYRESQRRCQKNNRKASPKKVLDHKTRMLFNRSIRAYLLGTCRDTTVIKFEELIGCSMNIFMKHIERQWKKDYNETFKWDFDGKELEHITDLASFNTLHPDGYKNAWNYKNLKYIKKEDQQRGRPRIIGVA